MLRTDVFFPKEPTTTPFTLEIGPSFKIQENEIGMSPDETLHWTVVESPRYWGSSPKENGRSFGTTETWWQQAITDERTA